MEVELRNNGRCCPCPLKVPTKLLPAIENAKFQHAIINVIMMLSMILHSKGSDDFDADLTACGGRQQFKKTQLVTKCDLC